MKRKVSVAVPASVVSDTPHLREKTSKIGLIGRAAAIFRVDEIIIYPDHPKARQPSEMNFIALLLSYMETPQYLRKRLFRLEPELQYAGILPPLRTPHHPLNRKAEKLKVDEFREGVALAKTTEGTLVDIGVEKPIHVRDGRLQVNSRVTVRITGIGKSVGAVPANRAEIPQYWGYTVTIEKRPFGRFIENSQFDLIVATSKYGSLFKDVAAEVAEKWRSATSVLLAFGSPTHGLHEIARHEGLKLESVVDFVVNMIPDQGTETVRTEEAFISSLSVLANCLSKA